jgi:hypothetical protein
MWRKLAALGLVVMMTAGCNDRDRALWAAWHAVDPVAALAFAEQVRVEEEAAAAHGRCGEWHDLAIQVGWTEEQWPTVDRIMFRESRCDPNAYHPKYGASGLMQVLARYTDDCGGNPGDLFDPAFNLTCSLWILGEQGWSAWSTW